MTISPGFRYQPEGSSELPQGSKGGNLILSGHLSSEVAEGIRDLEFSRVVLDRGTWDDLHSLRSHEIKELYVLGGKVCWDSVLNLTTLSAITAVGVLPAGVSFARLKNLKYLSAEVSSEVNWLSTLPSSLAALELTGAIATLESISHCKGLNHLRLVKNSQITSLDCFQVLPALKYAEVSHAPGLSRIGVMSKCAELETLNLFVCRNLTDLSGLGGAPALRELALDIGGIDSAKELSKCKSLERLRMECRVGDGDLSFIEKMPRLEFCLFRNSKKFNRTLAQIHKFLEEKGFDQAFIRDQLERFPTAQSFC